MKIEGDICFGKESISVEHLVRSTGLPGKNLVLLFNCLQGKRRMQCVKELFTMQWCCQFYRTCEGETVYNNNYEIFEFC
jgi:hypothetical protein